MKGLLKAIRRHSNTPYRWLLVKARGMMVWYRISRALSLLAVLVSFLQACSVYTEDLMPEVPSTCRWQPAAQSPETVNTSDSCWLVYTLDPSRSRLALADGSACYEGLECLLLRPGETVVHLANTWGMPSTSDLEAHAEAVSCDMVCP
jgi:hypothetical protein